VNSRSARWRSQRWTRSLLAGLLGGLLMVIGPWSPLWASPAPIRPSGPPAIPLREQPFYPELLAAAARWSDDPLGQVVGESPRETLLNFYAVMARVANELEVATRDPQQDPGLFWSPAARQRIDAAQQLFALAVQALDASTFPKSVRDDMADEAAMQLKEVLDYVFTHSTVPITIPDSVGLKTLNNQRSQASQNWTLGDTAITLTSEASGQEGSPGFVFSAGTVSQVGRMYREINDKPAVQQPFATPDLYSSYIYTPGYLAPPKWYLRLPADVRRVLEMAIDGQTLLQVCAVLATLLVYGWMVLIISRRLFYTYSYWLNDEKTSLRAWHQDNMAWYRVLLVLPMLPLTKVSEIFIDDYVNFTGTPLVVVTYLFFICYFVASSFFSFFLFEALGRSTSEWLVQLRGGGSSTDLQLRRVSNLVMPVCRALGGLVATVLIYRLLIALGLPSTTVLAFSAVPGLAIGLGASKLLGNLFAGLSIQTDRPLRVGEFCQIGDNLGYVTKIGLRSLELQTLESRITIPNAIADEETIVNYSRRSPNSAATPMQSLNVRLTIEQKLSPEQVDDLLQLVRHHMAGSGALLEPLVSIEQNQSDDLTLICFAMVTLHDWNAYLSVREALLMRLQQLVEQVRLSTITLGVSYDTTAEQLQGLPDLIRSVVNSEPLMQLQSCRFMTISAFSYDIVFRLHAGHTSFAEFKNAIHRLNQALLIALAAAQIEIPFPTQMQLQRDA
jgi:MscS family membrane protein